MPGSIALALAGLASGISISTGLVLVYRAERNEARADRDAARADTELTRERLATSMVLYEAAKFTSEAWKDRALASEWSAAGCPAMALDRPGLRLVVSNERRA